MSPKVQFFPWNFNAKKDFCIWNSPFPMHLYIIQAAFSSLGNSLDIKFSLNSLRIEQLQLSNYHQFVIMRGVQLEEGHGDRTKVRKSQGERDSLCGGSKLRKVSAPGRPGMQDKAISAPEPLSSFLARLFPSPWRVSSLCPSTSAWQAYLNKASQKKEEVKRLSLFCRENPGDDEKSIQELFEDASPQGAVRRVRNVWDRVCWLPDLGSRKHLCWCLDKDRCLDKKRSLDKDESRLEMTETAVEQLAGSLQEKDNKWLLWASTPRSRRGSPEKKQKGLPAPDSSFKRKWSPVEMGWEKNPRTLPLHCELVVLNPLEDRDTWRGRSEKKTGI